MNCIKKKSKQFDRIDLLIDEYADDKSQNNRVWQGVFAPSVTNIIISEDKDRAENQAVTLFWCEKSNQWNFFYYLLTNKSTFSDNIVIIKFLMANYSR